MTALALHAGVTSAAAQQTIAPPGNSALQEYMEVVPSAGGKATRPKGGSHAVSPKVHSELQQGQDGRQLEQLIDSTAPASHAARPAGERDSTTERDGRSGGRRSSERSDKPRTPGLGGGDVEAPGGSIVGSAARSLTTPSESGGMGPFLPGLLIGSLIVLAGIALRRRS